MGIKQIKIDVNEVTVGMFISSLDRPWTQTPFPLQGFYIRDQEEIKDLRVHCNHVYIDVVKGARPIKTDLKTFQGPAGNLTKAQRARQNAPAMKVTPIPLNKERYRVAQPVSHELGNAKVLHQQVYQAVGDVLEQIEKDALNVPISETKRYAGEMVESVIRNPDAFGWLSRVQEKDEYTYSHSVRSAVWAIVFGRHIGLSRNDLNALALGVLLKDVGKFKLDSALLQSAKRGVQDQAEFEKFVSYGVEILQKLPELGPKSITVVKHHCERVNGSGYPQRLRGDKISLLGKIAGIVTKYDETTNPRGASPLSPSKATAQLYAIRGVEFQADLVVEFIRAVGVYPTGTIVQLSTGEIAVVVEQNFEWRLKPKVMVVVDEYRQLLEKPYFMNLVSDTQKSTDKVEIVRDLDPGQIDIDITAVREKYIARVAKKGLMGFLKKSTGIFKG